MADIITDQGLFMPEKQRILTGDTPTGRLHLGHWVGSLENRVLMQDEYDCYFILANMHALTTRAENPAQIQRDTLDIAIDFLCAGIDPQKSCIFVQSDIPAISELTFIFSMLIPFPRLMRNPTIKDEIRDKGLGDSYPFGFLLYPVGQVADILAFRPTLVPVGEDQIPHLEMTREVARRFNQLYCGVDSHIEDAKHIAQGGLFPIIEPKLGRVKRLVGTGGLNEQGQLLKMSKSLNNSILLTDDADSVQRKVMAMYTDPKRLKATDPGSIDNNPLWIFHDTFNPDKAWVAEAKARYQAGKIGDVECKKCLVEVLTAFIAPLHQKRLELEKNMDYVKEVLRRGSKKANFIANETMQLTKEAIYQVF